MYDWIPRACASVLIKASPSERLPPHAALQKLLERGRDFSPLRRVCPKRLKSPREFSCATRVGKGIPYFRWFRELNQFLSVSN